MSEEGATMNPEFWPGPRALGGWVRRRPDGTVVFWPNWTEEDRAAFEEWRKRKAAP